MPAEEAHYFKKGDGGLSLRIKELEDENFKLETGLKKSA